MNPFGMARVRRRGPELKRAAWSVHGFQRQTAAGEKNVATWGTPSASFPL